MSGPRTRVGEAGGPCFVESPKGLSRRGARLQLSDRRNRPSTTRCSARQSEDGAVPVTILALPGVGSHRAVRAEAGAAHRGREGRVHVSLRGSGDPRHGHRWRGDGELTANCLVPWPGRPRERPGHLNEQRQRGSVERRARPRRRRRGGIASPPAPAIGRGGGARAARPPTDPAHRRPRPTYSLPRHEL